MTAAVDIKRITRVALERNPQWILHDRQLIVPPVDHYVRGFSFNGTRTSHYFHLSHGIAPLYELSFGQGVGARFETSFGSEMWDVRDRNVEEEIALRCEQESVRFAGVQSPRAFLRYAADFTDIEKSTSLILTHCLAGTPILAKKILLDRLFRLELDHWYESETKLRVKPYHPHMTWSRQLRRLLSILNDGPKRVEAFARTLAHINVQKLNLAEHWTAPWPKRRQ